MTSYYESFNSRVGTGGSYDLANSGSVGCGNVIGDAAYNTIDDGGRGVLVFYPGTIPTSWTSLYVWNDGWVFNARRARVYLYMYTYPQAGKYIQLLGGRFTDYMCSIVMNSTGKVALYHNGTVGTFSAASVPLNATIRVEVNSGANGATGKAGVWTDANSSSAPDIEVSGVTIGAGFYVPSVLGGTTSGGPANFVNPYSTTNYAQADSVRFDDTITSSYIGPETSGLLWSPQVGPAIGQIAVKVNKQAANTTYNPSATHGAFAVSTNVDRLNTSGAIVNKTVSVNVDRLNTSGQIVNKTYTTNNGAILGP